MEIDGIIRDQLKTLATVGVMFLFVFICSFFVWIWLDWNTAWKVGLTGLIGYIIIAIVYHFAKKIIKKGIEEMIEEGENIMG